jgi:hypothetical protein
MSDEVSRDEKGHFVSGFKGGPGRPKGSRNKLGEAFLDNLYSDWQENGVQALRDCRQQNPAAYVKTVASLLPKQVEVNTNGIASMSDDELCDLINAIRSADGAIISARDRAEETTSKTIAH